MIRFTNVLHEGQNTNALDDLWHGTVCHIFI